MLQWSFCSKILLCPNAFVILLVYVSTCSAKCVTQPLIIEGGLTDADINDPEVIAAAGYANNVRWEDYSDIKNSRYVITSVKSQVVSGAKYYLKVEYPEKQLSCDYEVTYQSWINKYSLVFKFCTYDDALLQIKTIKFTESTMEAN